MKHIIMASLFSLVSLFAFAQEPVIFTGHDRSISFLKVFPNSSRILSAGYRHLIEWDFETFQVIKSADYNNEIISIAISPNGQQYALSFRYVNSAYLFLSPDKNSIREFFGHSGIVYTVAFSPDGKYLLTGSEDKTAKLWDVETGVAIRTFTGHTGPIIHVGFSPNGEKVITASGDDTAKVWSIDDGLRPIWTFTGHTDDVTAVSYSSDGNKIATASSDRTIRIWSGITGQHILNLNGHTSAICNEVLAFSPDSKYLLSGSTDSTAILWNVETGLNLRVFSGFERYSYVYGVAFSNDGTKVIAGSTDSTIRIWDVSDLLVPVPTLLETPYDFALSTAEANGFNASAPASGDYTLAPLTFKNYIVGVGDQEFTDGFGGSVTLSPTSGVTLYGQPIAVDPRDYVFMRVSIRSTDANFSPAVGMLNATDGVPDGSMGLNLEFNGSRFVNKFDVLTTFLEPESDSIIPLVQFVGMPNGENITVEFDDLQIYRMPKTLFPVLPKNRTLFPARVATPLSNPFDGFIRFGDRIIDPADLIKQN